MFREKVIKRLERENKYLREENANYREELHTANNRINALKAIDRCREKIKEDYKDRCESAESLLKYIAYICQEERGEDD